MSLEENKQIVRSYFELINKKEMPKAFELLSEDLNWWIVGTTNASGNKDKRNISLGFKLIHRAFEGFHFIIHDMTAEDNRVSLTAESKGKHSSGRLYNNQYNFLFTIVDGKIASVKEYFDTEHARWIENG